MNITDEFIQVLDALKNEGNYDGDELYVAVENHCDDYAKGYLTRELEILGDSLYGRAYFEEFYYFAKKCKR